MSTREADIGAAIELTYYGHAAVGLSLPSGERLVVDPYEPGALRGALTYDSIPDAADYVVCSHDHEDHCAVEALPGSVADRGEGARSGPFEVRRYAFDHDEYGGERFGGESDALHLEFEGTEIVHLGDVGASPSGALPREMKGADLALVPTGGFYTIGAAQAWEWTRRLRPTIAVPIHYATDACQLPLHPLGPFLATAPEVQRRDGSQLEVPVPVERSGPVVVALEPKCL